MLFLAELNQLETWATDIGNAYLEAETSEKVCIVTGPEIGARDYSVLVVFKTLYGLRSGKQWHDKFTDDLRYIGFLPYKEKPDKWIRRSGNLCEYVVVYVENLTFVQRDPKTFIDHQQIQVQVEGNRKDLFSSCM